MDPFFSQVDKALRGIESDESVTLLVELITSIQSPIISEHVMRQVLNICQNVHPGKSLALLKFVFMYSKKDAKFLSLIRPHAVTIVMNCFRMSIDPGTTSLYIESWKMSGHWKDIIDPCLRNMRLIKNRDMLLHAVRQLAETDIRELILRLRKSPNDKNLCHEAAKSVNSRLDSVISVINSISSVI